MRLHLFRLGTVPRIQGPVPGYLIRGDDGTNVLVDTGASREPLPGLPDGLFDIGASEDVVAQLERLGLAPADIDHVVCTHLHPDHVGNHDAFPGAEFVIQRGEYEYALRDDSPRYAATRERWGAPGLTYRVIEGDQELLPGIELLHTPGHSPGHQSVLVRLPDTGPVLLAGDAMAMSDHTDADSRPITSFDMDARGVRASTRKLMELADREGAFVVFSHDGVQWSQLRTGADCYT